MKFSTTDENIQKISGNTLDLIHFDEILKNSKPGYPAFICRGQYIKTITKFTGVDFFNLTVSEQEERVQYWSRFLSYLKTPTQIFITSKPIETDKYLNEMIKQIRDSSYISEEYKKKMIQGLPMTLEHIKHDGLTSAFKKEYYIVTSSTIRFSGTHIQEDIENENDSSNYEMGTYKTYSDAQWQLFTENFNEYYEIIMGTLNELLDTNT